MKKNSVHVLFFLTIIIFCSSCMTTTPITITANKNQAITVNSDLINAIESSNYSMVFDQLENGASVNNTDNFNETPLFTAAKNGNIDLVALLLFFGSDFNAINVFGENPLHIAVEYGNTEAAILLNAFGTEIIEDSFGRNILDIAEERGYLDFPSEKEFNDRVVSLKKIIEKTNNRHTTSSNAFKYFTYAKFLSETYEDSDESWTESVSRITTEKMDKWLSLADYTIPDKISMPDVPQSIILIQEDFETNIEFQERVAINQQERQKDILVLQNEFAEKVTERNNQIYKLKQIQAQREINLPLFRSVFINFAMENIFTNIKFDDVSIDKKTGDLFFNNVSFNENQIGNYKVISAERELRETAYSNSDQIKLEIIPFSNIMGEFGIKELKVMYLSSSYSAFPTGENIPTQEPLIATVDDIPLSNKILDQSSIINDPTPIKVIYKDELRTHIVSIPGKEPDNKKWAFIIGVEEYLNTSNITYARDSAELFALAANRILGVPESHLITLYDNEATSGNVKSQLSKLLDDGIRQGDTVYFYYNGHGVPIPNQDYAPYILPYDIDIDYIENEPFFDLRNLYGRFQDSKAEQIIVFMDSCFTGQSIIGPDKAAPRLPPRKIDISTESKLAILTAGSDTQFSSAWPEKGHRLFTYFLIEALTSRENESKSKRIDLLFEIIRDNVSSKSREIGGPLDYQDPTFQGNGELKL